MEVSVRYVVLKELSIGKDILNSKNAVKSDSGVFWFCMPMCLRPMAWTINEILVKSTSGFFWNYFKTCIYTLDVILEL